MCFSAKVQQNVHKLARQFRAEVATRAFLDVFERRSAGEPIKVSRALEMAFKQPENATEKRINEVINAYSTSQAREWETEIFKQRQRLAGAEELLKTKDTKQARESMRIASKKIEKLLERLSDIKRADTRESDDRIYPMAYAPVIIELDGRRQVWPMRYTCRLAGKPDNYDWRYPGTYNARRDSLTGFWQSLYGRNHAMMVVNSFYENVPKHLYECRELVEGEKPSNLVLQFTPDTGRDMLVACLWDRWQGIDGSELYSFAAITDDPPQEIAATGHQRCVISLKEANLDEWLDPSNVVHHRLDSILGEKEMPTYRHRIAA